MPELLDGLVAATPSSSWIRAEQVVLGADEVVIQEPGLLLSQNQDPAGPVGETLEHDSRIPPHRPGRHSGKRPAGGCDDEWMEIVASVVDLAP